MSHLISVIELRKKHPYSQNYVAVEDGHTVALLRRPWVGNPEITLEDKCFACNRGSKVDGVFRLMDGNVALVELAKRRIAHREDSDNDGVVARLGKFVRRLIEFDLVFQFDSREFRIRNESLTSPTLLLFEGQEQSPIGDVISVGTFRSGVLITLPTRLPLWLRVFIGWVGIEFYIDSRDS